MTWSDGDAISKRAYEMNRTYDLWVNELKKGRQSLHL